VQAFTNLTLQVTSVVFQLRNTNVHQVGKRRGRNERVLILSSLYLNKSFRLKQLKYWKFYLAMFCLFSWNFYFYWRWKLK